MNDVAVEGCTGFNPSKLSGPHQWRKYHRLSIHEKSRIIQNYHCDVDGQGYGSFTNCNTAHCRIVGVYRQSIVIESLLKERLSSLCCCEHYYIMKQQSVMQQQGYMPVVNIPTFNMITILFTYENDGLEIFDKRGCQEWVDEIGLLHCEF
jgi:hypothetical protein